MNSTNSDNSSGSNKLSPLPWVEALFRNSPLKREKFTYVSSMLPQDLSGLSLVDIGGDNGVMSYKLRELGGQWSSVDLIEEAVVSIRKVVNERVYKLDNSKLPLPDSSFDVVVVVDMLEHLPDDRSFVEELSRVLKAGGSLIVNVPNPKEGILRKIRFALGQTDEKHGHVRPGYSLESLEKLLGSSFTVSESKSYSRLCAQLVDTVVNGGLELLKAGKRGKKGTLVTADTLSASKKNSFLLSAMGPILRVMIFIDRLFPFTHGSMLIVKAQKV